MARRTYTSIPVLGLLVLAGTTLAAEAPVTVSPGDASQLALVEGRCPTFSWGEVEGAKSYELVVYRVGDEDEAAQPVLRQLISGSALSWTPALDSCLARGGRYAWSVRATGGKEPSEWSAASLFEVAVGPSEAALEAALEVVRSYLAAGQDGAEASASVAEATEEREPAGPGSDEPPVPLAPPAATQLSVDGNIDATSYTGDGENLANVATDAELGAHDHLGGDGAAVVHSSLGSVGVSDHHTPTVDTDTFVTNRDAHDHLGGDGAAVLHSSLASVGASDHHTRFSKKEVFAAITAVNRECPGALDSGNRYTDCLNGTVRDNNTGLFWLKNANCTELGPNGNGSAEWPEAEAAAEALADGMCGLTDGSSAGDWRQPTGMEFCSAWGGPPLGSADFPCPAAAAPDSLIDSTAGPPTVAAGHPFVGVQTLPYWTSTEDTPTKAWRAALINGEIQIALRSADWYVWPVREGL